jgi:hypothetical protein
MWFDIMRLVAGYFPIYGVRVAPGQEVLMGLSIFEIPCKLDGKFVGERRLRKVQLKKD